MLLFGVIKEITTIIKIIIFITHIVKIPGVKNKKS